MRGAERDEKLVIGKFLDTPLERERFTDDRNNRGGDEQRDRNEQEDEDSRGCYAADSFDGVAAGLAASELELLSDFDSDLASDLASDLRESVT